MSIQRKQGAQTNGQIRMACPSQHKSSVFIMDCCKCASNKTRAHIFKSLVQGNYTVWQPANGKQLFVVFGRSGKYINGNGTNISDGSDIEAWIVDTARVKVEESYKGWDNLSDSSDDNESDIVKTTSNID